MAHRRLITCVPVHRVQTCGMRSVTYTRTAQYGMFACRGHLHLHPEWVQLLTADQQLLHYHRLANHFSDTLFAAPVGGTCGGFLCDEMVSIIVSTLSLLWLCRSALLSCCERPDRPASQGMNLDNPSQWQLQTASLAPVVFRINHP